MFDIHAYGSTVIQELQQTGELLTGAVGGGGGCRVKSFDSTQLTMLLDYTTV